MCAPVLPASYIRDIAAFLPRPPFHSPLIDGGKCVAAKRVPRPPQKNSLQWLNVSQALIEERRLELQVRYPPAPPASLLLPPGCLALTRG